MTADLGTILNLGADATTVAILIWRTAATAAKLEIFGERLNEIGRKADAAAEACARLDERTKQGG